jgi:hypothetical protein
MFRRIIITPMKNLLLLRASRYGLTFIVLKQDFRRAQQKMMSQWTAERHPKYSEALPGALWASV